MRGDKDTGSVVVEVELGRRLKGHLMTTYMPTILLNIIGHSTNYIQPSYFDTIVTVNLTVSLDVRQAQAIILIRIFPQVMLVLTTMFVGLSQTLPKTSYIKMVDIWLIFNLLIPFLEVLIHVYEVIDELHTFRASSK